MQHWRVETGENSREEGVREEEEGSFVGDFIYFNYLGSQTASSIRSGKAIEKQGMEKVEISGNWCVPWGTCGVGGLAACPTPYQRQNARSHPPWTQTGDHERGTSCQHFARRQ